MTVRDQLIELRKIAKDLTEAIDALSREISKGDDPKTPCPEGFYWIGQHLAHCDQCGFPAWEHAGWAICPIGANPFDADYKPHLKPFEEGEADRLKARWSR